MEMDPLMEAPTVPPDVSQVAPHVGMTFETMQEARKHIVQWCVKEHVLYKVRKADKRCWLLTCKDENCDFRLRVKNEDSPVISKLEPHSCAQLPPSMVPNFGASMTQMRPPIIPQGPDVKVNLNKAGPLKASPYDWPHDSSFGPRTTALVMIDMQRDFCSPGGYLEHQGYDITNVRNLIPGLQRLLFTFRKSQFPVYHTREGHRPDLSTLSTREAFRSKHNATGLGIGFLGPLGRLLIRGEAGHDTIPELYPIMGEPVIDKPGHGAFAYTDFDLLLRLRGIKNLIIAGVTTEVCVSSTMREANDRGFDCLLVEDGSAASVDNLHTSTCENVKTEGGIFGAVAKLEDVVSCVDSWGIGKRRGRQSTASSTL